MESFKENMNLHFRKIAYKVIKIGAKMSESIKETQSLEREINSTFLCLVLFKNPKILLMNSTAFSKTMPYLYLVVSACNVCADSTHQCCNVIDEAIRKPLASGCFQLRRQK